MGKAASLFNGAGTQTLIKRITPTEEQRNFLQAQWNALGEYLRTTLAEKSGLPVSTWLQGSYKYGTLIRPVQIEDEYDVDVGVYFEWRDNSAGFTARELRELVQREVCAYQAKCPEMLRVETPAKERCSRAIYSGRFHIDLPVYHIEPRKGKRRLACLSGEWEDSDPKTFYQWFKNEFNGDYREQVRRLVRYLKAWVTIVFENAPEARPSSILLTVLVSDAYKSVRSQCWGLPADDDALIIVVKKMFARLCDKSFVACPIDKRENLNRIPSNSWNAFMIRLRCLRDAAELAEHATEEVGAALAWSEAFSFLMPMPDVASVEFVDEGSASSLLPAPDIDIEIVTKSGQKDMYVHRNYVANVFVGSVLHLAIARPSELPDHATVEWTVRYEDNGFVGSEMLGEREIGVRAITKKLVIYSTGLHQVGCAICLNGRLYAARNVSVWVVNKGEEIRASPPNLKSVCCVSKRKLNLI
jgi:hypothetical protein